MTSMPFASPAANKAVSQGFAAKIAAAYAVFERAGHSSPVGPGAAARAAVYAALAAAQETYGPASSWCYSRAARDARGMDATAGDFLADAVQGWMPEDC